MLFADDPGVSYTKMSYYAGRENYVCLHPIIDGGKKQSVVGERQYLDICDELAIEPNVRELESNDPRSHAL